MPVNITKYKAFPFLPVSGGVLFAIQCHFKSRKNKTLIFYHEFYHPPLYCAIPVSMQCQRI